MNRRPYHGMVGPVSLGQPMVPNAMAFPRALAAVTGNVPGKFCPLPATSCIPVSRPQYHERPTLPALVPASRSMKPLDPHPGSIHPAYRLPLPSPHIQASSPQEANSLQFFGFEFTREDLDMVLYGYAKGKENDPSLGLALSGLRIGELSYGIDRILGQSSPRSSATSHVDPTSIDIVNGLELRQTTFAGMIHYGVFCKRTVITKGTKFGPFQGRVVNMSEIKTNDDNSFMWEIFKDGKLSHFIDGRGNSGNWMAYVNCARYAQEQNLIALQTDGEIYYEACKDVPENTELLVWYGDTYMQFMGIPICLKDSLDESNKTDQENGDGYTCDRCGKVFAYKYYRDKHLKYTRCVDQGNRKFPCHLCTRSFEKRDRLRIHILHVHEKHRPHKCHVCGKSFSQSSSLNKHMRVHSGERPYKCVYCSKAFTASSILRTHIRQHSGEKPFKCKHCGKAFASHAAHDSHVRRTHAKDKNSDINMNDKMDDPIDVVGYDTSVY